MTELVLIGAVALMVFGPRKLPQMARTIGKMMAEFRKATSDFKETWEREVDFDEFKNDAPMKPVTPLGNTIAKSEPAAPAVAAIASPEIREISGADFEKNFPAENREPKAEREPANAASGKQDWL